MSCATASRNAESCDTIIDEISLPERSCTYLVSQATPWTSTWLVGSSSSSRSGFCATASAVETRTSWPCDSEERGASSAAGRRSSSGSSATNDSHATGDSPSHLIAPPPPPPPPPSSPLLPASCSRAKADTSRRQARRRLGASWSTSATRTAGPRTTAPSDGDASPASRRSCIDLPQPDSPSTPSRCPRRTAHDCGARTRRSPRRSETRSNAATTSPPSAPASPPFSCTSLAHRVITVRRHARRCSGVMPLSISSSSSSSSSCHSPKPRAPPSAEPKPRPVAAVGTASDRSSSVATTAARSGPRRRRGPR
mmetsp:Transcript_28656/g.86726  ORF Transcript_28656/g.86726 Transcript_28656/m.86726 type:complete len:310 (+) Transcript_28656:1745-2674(+)